MRKTCSSVLALAAVTALAACGGSDDARDDGLGGANFTLTIVSPDHGAELQKGPVTVDVEVTGRGAANGADQLFDIGYFVDGNLAMQTRDHSVTFSLERGMHTVRVEGLLVNGQPDSTITGDEITILVDAAAVQPQVPVTGFQPVQLDVFDHFIGSNPAHDTANTPIVPNIQPPKAGP